jgi:hypothetical protein
MGVSMFAVCHMLLFIGRRKHNLKGYTRLLIAVKRPNKYIGGIVVTAVAAVGIVSLVMTHAAGNLLAIEPENGSLSAGATVVSNTGASGGQAVMFGSASTSACTDPVSGGELLTNGGFEGTYSGIAPNWAENRWVGSGSYARDTSTPHSGTAAQVINASGLTASGGYIFFNPFQFTAGQVY